MFLYEKENHICIRVDKELSLEEYLLDKNLSLKLIRRLYREKLIYVDGEFRRKDLLVYPNEEIKIYYQDEEDEIAAETMDLNIIYEDPGLLIISKPPGIPVHTSRLHQNRTLANGVKAYLIEKGLRRMVRLINRLDKDTTGLVMIAKNPISAHLMSLLIRENKIERRYLALVNGLVEKEEGIIDLPILKIEGEMKRIIDDSGDRALTKYKLLNKYKNTSLLELELLTGRGHQIRIHLSELGHPIVGDILYGGYVERTSELKLKSYKLKFIHPVSGQLIELMDGGVYGQIWNKIVI